MASVILIILFLLIIFYKIYKFMFFKPDNFPPGPPRIPIFGSYLILLYLNCDHLHKAALKLSEYYKSNIIGLYIGGVPTIIANDYKSCKEILIRKEFDGRPDIYAARIRDPDLQRKGIFFTDGPQWHGQRRFALRHLRDFGFGRRFPELEIHIREELTCLIDLIKNGPKYDFEKKFVRDGSVMCPNIFSVCSGNSLLKIFICEKLPREEHHLIHKAATASFLFQRTADDYGKLLSIIPWVRHVFPEKSGYRNLLKGNTGGYEFIQAIVDKEIQTYDENHERHFVDIYIKQIKEAEKTGDSKSEFLYDQLILILLDFLLPSITAVPVQITFLIQRLLLQPEILQKMQNEIDLVVGQGRLPELNDRINLSYTEATIREILRFETLVPSSIPHKAVEDTKYLGYTVPKGCFMIPSLYALQELDPIWKDPEIFRPERFLNENGKLILSKDISFPFGAGKRLCAGETFARNMMFLIVSTIAQNFNVKLPKGEKLPDLNQNKTGLITYTPDMWIYFESR